MRLTLLFALAATLVACNKDPDNDEDGFPASVDCNDEDASIHPDAEEVCDGIDNNCDDQLDVDATDAVVFYGDADGDGYGGEALTFTACEAPEGFLATNDDCDDTNADVNPAGTEICDGLDNDCDGALDDADDSVDLSTITDWYPDSDGDGFGDDTQPTQSCSAPAGHVIDGGDCDDTDPALNPETVWYGDVDGDGYGASDFTTIQCEAPPNHSAEPADCDDFNPNINPDAQEVCDGAVDNDCDGLIDDDDDSLDLETRTLWYPDVDTDGYGDSEDAGSLYCNGPSGTANNGEDCDDSDITVSPAEVEVCNDGLDNDCSGDAPECGLTGDVSISTADVTATAVTSDGERFGWQVTVLDADGDGNDDLFISDYWDDAGGTYDAGAVYGFYGPITGAVSASTADWSTYGGTSSGDLGYGMDAPGDMDGDGYEDLLVGGPDEDTNGVVSLFSGSASGMATEPTVQLTGAASSDDFGASVAGIGDVDGDGSLDFAVGAPGSDNNGSSSGSVYLWFGVPSADQSADEADVIINGSSSYDYLGQYNGITHGDYDGDGSDDVVYGGYGADSYYGATYIAYGPFSSGVEMEADDADAKIAGTGTYDDMGSSNKTGDVNGDGYDDLIATEYDGATSTSSYNGAAYVYFGSASSWSGSVSTNDADAVIAGAADYDDFGQGLAVGDVNSDGTDDIVIGAPYNDDAGSSSGKVYGFMGPITSGSSLVAGTDNTVSIAGGASSDYCGRNSVGTGDVNGDGTEDFIVPCYGAGTDGEVYVFFGGGM